MTTVLACTAVRTKESQIVRVNLPRLFPGMSVEFTTQDGARWRVAKTIRSRVTRPPVWGREVTNVRVVCLDGTYESTFMDGFYTVVPVIAIGHQFSMIDPRTPGRRIALDVTTSIRIAR